MCCAIANVGPKPGLGSGKARFAVHIQPFPTSLRSWVFTPAFTAHKKRPTSECRVTGCRSPTGMPDQVIATIKPGVLCVLSSKHRFESKAAAARGFGRESPVFTQYSTDYFWNRSEHNEWGSPTSFVRLMLCSLALGDTLPPCFRQCRVGAFPLPAVFLPLHDPRPTSWLPCPGVIRKAKSKARRVLVTVQSLWASTDIPAASRLPAWAPKQAA